MDSIIDIAYWGLVGIFTIAISYIIGIVILGGNMYSMMQEFTPDSTAHGIQASQYQESSNDIWTGVKYAFYILISFIFIFMGIKALYEKESATSYYG